WRKEVVDQIREASGKWGFFLVVNHRISEGVLEEMKAGVRRFHELGAEQKEELFERDDLTKKIVYNSNFDLYSAPFANCRDTITFHMGPDPPEIRELPACCRYTNSNFWERFCNLFLYVENTLVFSDTILLPRNNSNL
ncbi:1-aminocyclopropane-1-carboxylate oxidase homolog 12, partial [Linum grandiflorum]